MRERFGRAGAITRLLVAIVNDLSRRTWWAYRSSGHKQAPRTTIVARRPLERHEHVPKVTAAWQPLVSQALPVLAGAATPSEEEELIPVAWIDATDRPDISDLPRVLASAGSDDEPPVVATQWLVDPAASRILLVVTFVEPVVSSWAMSFIWPQARPLLELTLNAAGLVVALGQPPEPTFHGSGLVQVTEPSPYTSIFLPITSLVQLAAILDSLSAKH